MARPETDRGSVNRLSTFAVVGVLAVFVAIVVAADRLGSPYYAIVHLIGYVFLFGYVAVLLRNCYRVARSPRVTAELNHIAFWVGLTAFGALRNVRLLFRTQDRDVIRLATDGCLLIALVYALGLLESLIRASTAEPTEQEPADPNPGNGTSPGPC